MRNIKRQNKIKKMKKVLKSINFAKFTTFLLTQESV